MHFNHGVEAVGSPSSSRSADTLKRGRRAPVKQRLSPGIVCYANTWSRDAGAAHLSFILNSHGLRESLHEMRVKWSGAQGLLNAPLNALLLRRVTRKQLEIRPRDSYVHRSCSSVLYYGQMMEHWDCCELSLDPRCPIRDCEQAFCACRPLLVEGVKQRQTLSSTWINTFTFDRCFYRACQSTSAILAGWLLLRSVML